MKALEFIRKNIVVILVIIAIVIFIMYFISKKEYNKTKEFLTNEINKYLEKHNLTAEDIETQKVKVEVDSEIHEWPMGLIKEANEKKRKLSELVEEHARWNAKHKYFFAKLFF